MLAPPGPQDSGDFHHQDDVNHSFKGFGNPTEKNFFQNATGMHPGWGLRCEVYVSPFSSSLGLKFFFPLNHGTSILLETSWKSCDVPDKMGRMKSFTLYYYFFYREFVSIQYSTDLFKPYFWVNHFCGR